MTAMVEPGEGPVPPGTGPTSATPGSGYRCGQFWLDDGAPDWPPDWPGEGVVVDPEPELDPESGLEGLELAAGVGDVVAASTGPDRAKPPATAAAPSTVRVLRKSSRRFMVWLAYHDRKAVV